MKKQPVVQTSAIAFAICVVFLGMWIGPLPNRRAQATDVTSL